jgi:hypothetical protein
VCFTFCVLTWWDEHLNIYLAFVASHTCTSVKEAANLGRAGIIKKSRRVAGFFYLFLFRFKIRGFWQGIRRAAYLAAASAVAKIYNQP